MKVLVVVDMQNDFITGSLGSEEAKLIVPNVVKKIKEYNNTNNLVVFTKDTHYKDSYLTSQEGKNLPIYHCLVDTEGWKINDECRNAWKETKRVCIADNLRNTFYKYSFGSIDLAEFIKNNECDISSVEFCGLCTDICVVSNVVLVKAFCPELPIVVDESCCAGVTPELHKNAVNTMKSLQVNVINKEEK